MDPKQDAPLPRSQSDEPSSKTPRADPGMQTKDVSREGMPRRPIEKEGAEQGLDREQSTRNQTGEWPSGEDSRGAVPDFDRPGKGRS